jgi:1,4-alpha-glucan branching enzyme
MLIDTKRMLAAELLLALLPTPILLFMGDEFRAPSLFPFFCDFGGDLGRAVEEGRRREFAEIGDQAAAVPLPTAAEARAAAVLDWDAPRVEPHASALARTRAWLKIRRDALNPRLPARAQDGEMLGERALFASWRLKGGTRLRLVANLDDGEARAPDWPGGELLAATSPRRAGAPLPPWHVSWSLEPP